MEAIRKIKLDELAPRPSEGVSLATRSGPPLPAGMGLMLSKLMAEAQAFMPNQTLPEGTPDMYLTAWEEIALRVGLKTFREGLWKALREADFFPSQKAIEERCMEIRRAEGDRHRAQEMIRQHDEAKAQWERERAEDAKETSHEVSG
jgi:hypothetical protein